MESIMTASEIRTRYVALDEQFKQIRADQKVLAEELIKIMENEPDVEKRKEIIDMVFKGNVEEFHEYYFRKVHIEGRTDLL